MANLALHNERCEHCRRARRAMVAMMPGSDGKTWWLCVACWADGVKAKASTIVVAPEPVPEPVAAPKPRKKAQKGT